MERIIIGITTGDPNGIGPEVVIRALSKTKLKKLIIPVVFGNENVIEKAIKLNKSNHRIIPFGRLNKEVKKAEILYFVKTDSLKGITKYGAYSHNSGLSSYQAVKVAVDYAMRHRIDGVVTAPISKKAWKLNNVPFPGHTELIAALTNAKSQAAMMFVNGPFRLMLATIHTPLRDVAKQLTSQKLIQLGILCHKTLRDYFKCLNPTIAFAGLNPHAGEEGEFGQEEARIINPAINALKERFGINAQGPFPADSLFRKEKYSQYDVIVSMYHDQGLIPFKMLAMEHGVNVTVGVPIIRTSPDHGTAYDIAGKGIAQSSSMEAAIEIAYRMITTQKRART